MKSNTPDFPSWDVAVPCCCLFRCSWGLKGKGKELFSEISWEILLLMSQLLLKECTQWKHGACPEWRQARGVVSKKRSQLTREMLSAASVYFLSSPAYSACSACKGGGAMSRGQVVCFAPPHTSEQSWIILLNEVSGVKLVRQLRSKHRKRKDPFSWHLTRL